jgi:hypothetical protein
MPVVYIHKYTYKLCLKYCGKYYVEGNEVNKDYTKIQNEELPYFCSSAIVINGGL